jgi:signal transduction histidine kinase
MSPTPGMQGAPEGATSADVLRAVAHEIRQPLGTIESIAYYLGLVLPRENEKIHEQLARLLQLVEQSNWILSSGLHLADPLLVSPEPLDVEELITQAVSARASAGDPAVQLDLRGSLPQVRLDPGLGRALIVNLLTLFRQLSTEAHPVRLRTSAAAKGVWIEISTAAPGFGSEAMLGPGSALSIRSARRIAEAHGGSLSVEIDHASGIQLRMMLP